MYGCNNDENCDYKDDGKFFVEAYNCINSYIKNVFNIRMCQSVCVGSLHAHNYCQNIQKRKRYRQRL